jgi:hypothetical protein
MAREMSEPPRQLLLGGGIGVTLLEGEPPFHAPRWWLESEKIMVSDVSSACEWHSLLRSTMGSDDESGMGGLDYFLFHKESGDLAAVQFALSGGTVDLSDFDLQWRNCPTVAGTLRVARRDSFSVEWLDACWIHPDGATLANFRGSMAISPDDLLRICIARDFYLLFSAGIYFGWLMDNPSKYLGDSWSDEPASPDDSLSGRAIAEYLRLISHTSIDLMIDEDQAVLENLKELHHSLDAEKAHRAAEIMQRKIKDVIPRFYDIEDW